MIRSSSENNKIEYKINMSEFNTTLKKRIALMRRFNFKKRAVLYNCSRHGLNFQTLFICNFVGIKQHFYFKPISQHALMG